VKAARAAAALAAVAFGCAAYVYVTLPDVRPLRTSNPATTAFMELRAAQARAKGEAPRRVHRWVSYDRMSLHLTRAVVVAEDAAFWRHSGIDLEQVRESLEVNIRRRELARGASTITQQLAKNLYLSPSKNPVRKLREMLIARRLEAELDKRRILELYLNLIEWGDGVYGAEAAARTHFGKSAAALGPEEAALLAGAIVSPRVLSPGRPSARLRQRQGLILRRMGGGRAQPAPIGPIEPEGIREVPADEGLKPVPPLPEPPEGGCARVLPLLLLRDFVDIAAEQAYS